MIRRIAGILLALIWAGGAQASVVVELCFNYGCSQTVPILLSDEDLERVGSRFGGVTDAAGEREVMAQAVADLYRIAGGQSPILADRGGNFLDGGVEGRMDCIDHSTTTTLFLELMSAQGWLRHHVVLKPSRRTSFIFQHFSALVEEQDGLPARVSHAAPEGFQGQVDIMPPTCDCPDVAEDVTVSRATQSGPGDVTAQFVVDSWFADHALPAVIMPLANWLNGEGPDVQ